MVFQLKIIPFQKLIDKTFTAENPVTFSHNKSPAVGRGYRLNIQFGISGFDNGKLCPDRIDAGEVELHEADFFPCTESLQNRSPGIHSYGIGIGYVLTIFVASGSGCQSEQLVIDGAGTEQDLPVGRTGCHVEGCRNEQDFRTAIAHGLSNLLASEIEADAKSHEAELRFEGGGFLPRGQNFRFEEPLSAGNVDIEQVSLSMAGDLVSAAVINEGCIVDPVIFQFRKATADQIDMVSKDQLQYAFREFLPFIDNCRFSNCSHVKERGCAVIEALNNGEIQKSRHSSYVRLYEQAKNIKEWESPDYVKHSAKQ